MPTVRWSEPLVYVLAMFVHRGDGWLHGYEISTTAEIGPGTLYPLLARLEERRWIRARWEEPSSQGRPPRRAYQLTKTGEAAARRILAEQRSHAIATEVRAWT